MSKYWYYFTALIYWVFNAPFFAKLGLGSRFVAPLRLSRKYISCGRNVYAWKYGRFEGIVQYNNQTFTPMIELADGVSFQQGAHITCAEHISIGANTACAANVTITDIHHPYDDVTKPIEKQDIIVKPVKIGCNCKIYNNAVILPGTTIGEHVTIGANAVVGGPVPSFCVVAGGGGKSLIIKRLDARIGAWRRTYPNGDFIESDEKSDILHKDNHLLDDKLPILPP